MPANNAPRGRTPPTPADLDLTMDTVRHALLDCYDPKLPCNIVDLGLIRDISVTPDPEAPGAGIPGVPNRFIVRISLTPTEPGDDIEAQLGAQIVNRLAGLEAVSQTTLHFLPDPPWTPARISPRGRRTLGLDRNPTLIQIRP